MGTSQSAASLEGVKLAVLQQQNDVENCRGVGEAGKQISKLVCRRKLKKYIGS